jgi:uncharacterized protein
MLVQIEAPDRATPPPPELHRFSTGSGEHVLAVNGSRVFSIPMNIADQIDRASGEELEAVLARYGLAAPRYIDDQPIQGPPVRALSLSIAQKCNLACSYCYAQEGNFGREERDMEPKVAFAALDLMLADAAPGDRFNLTFLGGEPLTNRALLRACTERAAAIAGARAVSIGFSITTNATLLTVDDGDFFERYGFAVSVSLDGLGEENDRLRPFKGGKGSYARVLNNVLPLLRSQKAMQVSARVTVTPANVSLRETLDSFLGMGFHSVGFSPMLRSPGGRGEMSAGDLDLMLARMIACGEEFERRIGIGERYAFSNMYTALHEIHKGSHRPYPCGAGASYLSVSAEGELYACHRFVEDETGHMGNITSGIDRPRQDRWLADRHLHQQQPCRSCWARYLCGGGCHYEVIHQGRPACDYIRGWLHYCLQAYIRMTETSPRFFGL